jgi:hypothetical protein
MMPVVWCQDEISKQEKARHTFENKQFSKQFISPIKSEVYIADSLCALVWTTHFVFVCVRLKTAAEATRSARPQAEAVVEVEAVISYHSMLPARVRSNRYQPSLV